MKIQTVQTTTSWSCYGITARSWCRVRTSVLSQNRRRHPETPTMPPPPVLPRPGRFDRSSTISINISSCEKAKWLRGFTIQSTTTYLRWIRLSAPISSTRRPPLTTAAPCKLSLRLSWRTTAPCLHRLDLQFRCRGRRNRRRRTSRTSWGTTREPPSRAWRPLRGNPQLWIRAIRRRPRQRFRKLWGTRRNRRKEAPALLCLRQVPVAEGARWCATWLRRRRREVRVALASRFRWRRRRTGSGRVGRRRNGSLRARWVIELTALSDHSYSLQIPCTLASAIVRRVSDVGLREHYPSCCIHFGAVAVCSFDTVTFTVAAAHVHDTCMDDYEYFCFMEMMEDILK